MLASGVLEGQIVIPDEVLQELAAQGFSLNSTNSIDSTFTSSTGGTSRGGLTPVGGSKSVKGSKGGKGGLARKCKYPTTYLTRAYIRDLFDDRLSIGFTGEEVGLGFQVFIGVGDLPLWDIPTDTWVGNLTEVQTLMPGGPESPACQVSGAITLFPDSYNEPVEQITFQGKIQRRSTCT